MVEYFSKSERLQKKNKKQLITLAMSSSEKKRKQNNSKKKERKILTPPPGGEPLTLAWVRLAQTTSPPCHTYQIAVSLEQTFEVCRSVLILH